MNKFLGGVMIFMALVLAVAPVFTDCQSQGKFLTTADARTVSMKCHWAGIAEIAAAVPLSWQAFTRCATGVRRRRALPVSSAWRRA